MTETAKQYLLVLSVSPIVSSKLRLYLIPEDVYNAFEVTFKEAHGTLFNVFPGPSREADRAAWLIDDMCQKNRDNCSRNTPEQLKCCLAKYRIEDDVWPPIQELAGVIFTGVHW